jgi:hypothetical protein
MRKAGKPYFFALGREKTREKQNLSEKTRKIFIAYRVGL